MKTNQFAEMLKANIARATLHNGIACAWDGGKVAPVSAILKTIAALEGR